MYERKTVLKKLVADTDVQFSESVEIDGGEIYKHVCKTGLEGVVSKVRDSRYGSPERARAGNPRLHPALIERISFSVVPLHFRLFETCCDVRSLVAIGGKAEVTRTSSNRRD